MDEGDAIHQCPRADSRLLRRERVSTGQMQTDAGEAKATTGKKMKKTSLANPPMFLDAANEV